MHFQVEDTSRNGARSPFWNLLVRGLVTIKLGGTIFFTLVATMVVLVSKRTDVDLGVSNQLLTVLGLVLGFVISFRTSSAYERYQEGRKMWTNIIVASRSLAHQIWIHVLVDQPRKSSGNNGGEVNAPAPKSAEIEEEKLNMIKLVQAFSVSVKHLLRGEESVYYKDLYPLVHFLPKCASGTDKKMRLWHIHQQQATSTEDSKVQAKIPCYPAVEPQCLDQPKSDSADTRINSASSSVKSVRALNEEFIPQAPTRMDTYVSTKDDPDIPCEYVLKDACTPPDVTIFDYFSALKYIRFVWRVITGSSHPPENNAKTRRRKVYTEIVTVHVPIEICLVLSNYANFLMRNHLVDPVISSHIADNLFLLQDTVSNLERICNTPLPFAYQAHLKMSLWIYLVVLPFQIYPTYHLVAIPATAFAAFLMLGFLDIAEEIENPFDYDFNDLDLDHFCSIVKRDIHEITAYSQSGVKVRTSIWKSWNKEIEKEQEREHRVLRSP